MAQMRKSTIIIIIKKRWYNTLCIIFTDNENNKTYIPVKYTSNQSWLVFKCSWTPPPAPRCLLHIT